MEGNGEEKVVGNKKSPTSPNSPTHPGISPGAMGQRNKVEIIMISSRNRSILLTLSATLLNLDTWEAERWDWDGTASTALYPIDFSDHTVKVLQRLAHIAGLAWSEIRDASMYVSLPDNISEPVTLHFLQAMNGSPILELEMPQVSQEARTAIRELHAPTLLPAVIEALTVDGGLTIPHSFPIP